MDKIKTFFKRLIIEIMKFFVWIYFIVVYRVKVIGRENIPKDKKEPLIYCGNHQSYKDAPLIYITSKRYVRLIGKAELKNNKFFAFMAIIFDAIFINRDTSDMAAIKTILKALKQKDSIVIFPEGTRNGLEKGAKVKDGAAFFAVRTGTKVIPIGISGGEKPFKQMTIRYGKTMDFSNRSKAELDEVTEEIMNEIIELSKPYRKEKKVLTNRDN